MKALLPLLGSGVLLPLLSATVRHKVTRWWQRRDGDRP